MAKTDTLHTTSAIRKPAKKSSEVYAKFSYRERLLTSMATLIRGKKSRVVHFDALVAQVILLGKLDGDRLGGRVTHYLTMVREQLLDENILETGLTKTHLQFCAVPFLLLFSFPGLLSITGDLTTTTPTQRKKLWSTFHYLLIFQNMPVSSPPKRKATQVCEETRVSKKVRFSDVPIDCEMRPKPQTSCSCASRPPHSLSVMHPSSGPFDSLDDDMDEDEDLTDGETTCNPSSSTLISTEVEEEAWVEELLLVPSYEELAAVRAKLDETVRREREAGDVRLKLEDEIQTLKSKLETADEEHLRVQVELAVCRVTLELAEDRIHVAERKEAVSNTELEKTSAELESLRQELHTTRERVKSLEKEVEVAEKKTQTLSLMMRAIKDSVETAEMSLSGGNT